MLLSRALSRGYAMSRYQLHSDRGLAALFPSSNRLDQPNTAAVDSRLVPRSRP